MNKAFTLIELIIVIVLLGILAATALPRFIDFSKNAESAKYQALAASISTGSMLVHNTWQAKGKPTSPTEKFDTGLKYYNGDPLEFYMNSNGYIYRAGDCNPGEHSCRCIFARLIEGTKPGHEWFAAEMIDGTGHCYGTPSTTCDFRITNVSGTAPEYYDLTCVYRNMQGAGNHTITYDASTGKSTYSGL